MAEDIPQGLAIHIPLQFIAEHIIIKPAAPSCSFNKPDHKRWLCKQLRSPWNFVEDHEKSDTWADTGRIHCGSCKSYPPVSSSPPLPLPWFLDSRVPRFFTVTTGMRLSVKIAKAKLTWVIQNCPELYRISDSCSQFSFVSYIFFLWDFTISITFWESVNKLHGVHEEIIF